MVEDPGEPLFSFQSKAPGFEAPEELEPQFECKVSVCLSRYLSFYLSPSRLGESQFLFNVQVFSWFSQGSSTLGRPEIKTALFSLLI